MTLNEFQRAQLAARAMQDAGEKAAVEVMKGIAICYRNRRRKGWHNSDWLEILENADQYLAHAPALRVAFDANNRNLQRFLREVDDVYFGRDTIGGEEKSMIAQHIDSGPLSLEESLKDAVYFAFLGRPYLPWFISEVIQRPEEHRQIMLGTTMFFE